MLTPGGNVKISRREVKTLMVVGLLALLSNSALRRLVRRVKVKPFTLVPSASVRLPIASGAGTSAVNSPKAAADNRHTSTSIPGPAKPGARTSPGFGGVVFASA